VSDAVPYRADRILIDFTSFCEAVVIRPQFPFLISEPRHTILSIAHPRKSIVCQDDSFGFPLFPFHYIRPIRIKGRVRSRVIVCQTNTEGEHVVVDIGGPHRCCRHHRRRPHPRRCNDVGNEHFSHRTYAYNLLLGSWICLRLSLSSRWCVSAMYKHAYISPLLIHFQGIRNPIKTTATTTYPLILSPFHSPSLRFISLITAISSFAIVSFCNFTLHILQM